MERKNKISILIATITLTILILFFRAPLNKQTISTRFVAGENMGFDLDPGKLNFGQIVPGYGASRTITITNTLDKPTITTIESSGKISKYIIVSENNFILQPNESKEISFSCYAEKETAFGEYNGEIIIITNKA